MSSTGVKLELQPVKPLFWRYVLPAIMAMMVNGAYQICDAFFIGRYVGSDGLAALNLTFPIVGVLYAIAMMVAVGGMALSSVARGAQDVQKAKNYLQLTLVTLVLVGILISVFLTPSLKFFLGLLGAEGEILSLSYSYAVIASVFAVLAMSGIAIPIIVRNDESPKFATFLMALGAGLNIVLDWVFIVFADQALAGVAIATLISQSIVAVLGFGYFFSSYAKIKLTMSDLFCFDLKRMYRIVATGVPTFMMHAYFSFMIALHNYLFLEYGSFTTVAAFTICGYLMMVNYLFAEGIATGVQPLVSYHYGANRKDRIKEFVRISTFYSIGAGALYVVFLNLFPETILKIFVPDDPKLLAEGIVGIRLHLFSIYLDGYIVIVTALLQAMTYTRASTILSLGNMLIQIPLLFILPLYLGVNGVWLAMPISNVFLGIVAFMMICHYLKRPIKMHFDDDEPSLSPA